jgi:putative transposase
MIARGQISAEPGGWLFYGEHEWKDHLLLFDLGYFKYQLFDRISRNGGFFITRLKKNANPLIVSLNRQHRGQAVKVEGQRLRDVIGRLERDVLDVNVEVVFARRRYAGRVRRARQTLRVVGIKNAETNEYHLYATNVPEDRVFAEDVGIVYTLRWQIELLFKELKTHFRLEDIPSRKAVVVEALLYAALLTLVASRRVLAAVRQHLRRSDDALPTQRWAAIFVSVARELLIIVTRRLDRVRGDLREVTRMLLHEAVDPNRKRNGLLRAVETGLRRLEEDAADA